MPLTNAQRLVLAHTQRCFWHQAV